MSLWLALETKAPVSREPIVFAEVAPTAAPVASWALLTAAPAVSAVLLAALPAASAVLPAAAPAASAVLFAALPAPVSAGFLQAASERAAAAAADRNRTFFMELSHCKCT